MARTEEELAQEQQLAADEQNLTPDQVNYLEDVEDVEWRQVEVSPGLLTKPCPYCDQQLLTSSIRSAHIKRSHPEMWLTESSSPPAGGRVQWAKVAGAKGKLGRPLTPEELSSLAPTRRPTKKAKKPGPKKKLRTASSAPAPRSATPAPHDSLARQAAAIALISNALKPLNEQETHRVLLFVQDSSGMFEYMRGKRQ